MKNTRFRKCVFSCLGHFLGKPSAHEEKNTFEPKGAKTISELQKAATPTKSIAPKIIGCTAVSIIQLV